MTAPIVKLSQLTSASSLTGTETVPVVQGGVTKRTTSAALIPVPVEKFVFNTLNEALPGPGEMSWNIDDGTIDIGLNESVVLQLGQETLMRAKATASITSGQCVMVTGADGNSGRITAAPANGTGVVDGLFIIGIATQNIANAQVGFVTTFGIVRGVATNGSTVGETWGAGDVLYPHPTIIGGLTKGSHVLNVPVAIVLFAANNGTLFVRR
jgi:hypothetical protein